MSNLQDLQEVRAADQTRDEAEYAKQFMAAVAAGADKALPTYYLHGKVVFSPVSEFLGECHKDAQALLFRACHEAEEGNAVMALSLLKAFTKEVATEYGVTTAEAVSLIADPEAA